MKTGSGTLDLSESTIDSDGSTMETAAYEARCERFIDQLLDVGRAQNELFAALRSLIEQQQYQMALEQATKGLEAAQDADNQMTAELTTLRENPLASSERAKRYLASGEPLLLTLRAGKPALENRIKEIKQIAKANDPVEFERKFKENELTRQIDYLKRRGEIPKALDVYDQLYELTKKEAVKGQKAKLEEEWKPKSPEHEAARKFVANVWPRLTSTDEIKVGTPKLRAAVEQMAKSQDGLGLRLIQTGILTAFARLREIKNTLDPDLIEDKERLKVLPEVLEELHKVDELAREAGKNWEKSRVGEPLSMPVE